MIYFSTATYHEAAPLIEKYRMKKATELSTFQVFRGDNACLVISGIGGSSAAIAVTYLLTMSRAMDKDCFVNMGVCAAADPSFDIGDIILCNRLINEPMGKIFFPDMLLSHPFREAALLTCAGAVRSRDYVAGKAELADMEGAFAFEAAARFIPPHRIFIVKVVSDLCQPEKVRPDAVKRLMAEAVEKFFPWLQQAESFFMKEERAGILSQEDMQALDLICEKLNFSRAMAMELVKLAGLYKARHGDGLPELLEQFLQLKAGSRAEGKKYFSRIKELLLE